MKLRRATPADAADLLRWRNDPDTRAMSFEQGEVAAGDHEAWLAAKLADPLSEMWIGIVDGRPVGQVRFDLDDSLVAVVSISVDPAVRRAGTGTLLLTEAIEALMLDATRLRAFVRPENAASLRLFERCGFATTSRSSARVVLERPVVR